VQCSGNLFSVMFGEVAEAAGVHSYAQVQASDTFRYPPFFHAMLDAGVSLPPSVYEAWFVSAAHDDTAVGKILLDGPVPAVVFQAGVALGQRSVSARSALPLAP